jgi:hypothetical protein
LPSTTPRAFAAASAALVRSEIAVRSCSATSANDADGETVGVSHVHGHELDAGLLQAEQEVRVAAEAIELRNDQLGVEGTAGFDGLGERRPRSTVGVFNQAIGAL